MIVAVLLGAIVVVVCVSGFVMRRNTSAPLRGVYLDVDGAHEDAIVDSLQEFGPRRGNRGFDMQHWTSVHWG